MANQTRTDTDLRRRRLLQLCGAATATTLAGCSVLGGESDDSEIWGSKPDYASWVGAGEAESALDGGSDDGLVLSFVDASRFDEFDDGDGDDSGNDENVDPIVVMPTTGILVFSLTYGFGTFGYPFIQRVKLGAFQDESEQPSDPVAEIETGLLVGDSLVLDGDVDVDALVDAAEGFEQVESRGRFDLYEQGEGGMMDGSLAFAVADDALVMMTAGGDDGETSLLERLQDRIDVGIGETARAADENERFERFVRATTPGVSLLGTFGSGSVEDDDEDQESGESDGFEAFDQALDDVESLGGRKVGIFGSVDTGGGDSFTAEITLGYEDEDARPSKADVEDVFASEAGERTVTLEDEFVHVSAETTSMEDEQAAASLDQPR